MFGWRYWSLACKQSYFPVKYQQTYCIQLLYLFQCWSHASTSWQPSERFWSLRFSSEFAFRLLRDSERESLCPGGHLLEDEMMIACGSDHGRIYTFSVGTAQCIQKIKHGSSKSLVQVLSVSTRSSFPLPFHLIINYQGSSTRERHLIVGGTNDKMPNIYVWEKHVGSKYTYIYRRVY